MCYSIIYGVLTVLTATKPAVFFKFLSYISIFVYGKPISITVGYINALPLHTGLQQPRNQMFSLSLYISMMFLLNPGIYVIFYYIRGSYACNCREMKV